MQLVYSCPHSLPLIERLVYLRRLTTPSPCPPRVPSRWHSVKMVDTPIPDYLVDMLKEAGEIDENGKPLNDFFDPNDDDAFGSKRMREHNAEPEVPS